MRRISLRHHLHRCSEWTSADGTTSSITVSIVTNDATITPATTTLTETIQR
ncbi:MAG: hypothetical protein IPO38_08660 [Rhodocyclaceae bacterium]|nr:hypothetical protein [Rhodocyclaceae bacterium]